VDELVLFEDAIAAGAHFYGRRGGAGVGRGLESRHRLLVSDVRRASKFRYPLRIVSRRKKEPTSAQVIFSSLGCDADVLRGEWVRAEGTGGFAGEGGR
jgi:hypothetical protein